MQRRQRGALGRWGQVVAVVWALAGCAGGGAVKEAAPVASHGPSEAPHAGPASQAAGYPEVTLDVATRQAAWGQAAPAEREARLRQDASWLADDAREGRGVGSAGLEASARYIADAFAAAGLEPAGEGGSWFQPFQVLVGTALGPAGSQQLEAEGASLAVGEAWRPFAFSESGSVSAPVVFAGYGISAPELGYDDYAGVDVKGKVVVVLRHEPQRRDPHSLFNGDQPSRYSDLRYKAHAARNHGASALIVINDPQSYGAPKDDDPDALYRFQGGAGAGLLAAHVTWAGGGAWAKERLGLDLAALQAQIDAELKPRSQEVGRSLTLRAAVERREAEVRNVVGVLRPPGDGALEEAVVIGAHYDHLGMGGEDSLRPDVRAVHNGADDNASGTAALLELARGLGAARGGLRRPVYFVAFTAEEIGVRGSQWFVEHPPVPTQRFAAMVNMDMVGRLREGTLHVSGVGTAEEFGTLSREAAEGLGLRVVQGRDGYGPSDHAPFYAQQVPVLFLFTGPHEQYHTPEDDAALLNTAGLVTVVGYAERLLRYLAAAPSRPTYTQADARVVVCAGDSGGRGQSGYGPGLGTVPSFGDTGGGGVKLQGVRAGSPAEAAGLQGGDIIIEFDSKTIKDLYDLTYALRERKPGDVVKIVVMRGEARVEAQATLAKRP